MTECSQKFQGMLAEYRRGVHHEDLMVDDFVANPVAILQYVAELEAAYTAPAPAHAVPDADGARFRWLHNLRSICMVECSQKFQGMLTSFYDEAYEDGEFQCDMSGPSRGGEAAILQYVAELEAAYTAPAPAHAEPASPEPGEWIEWAGGECPLNDSVRHSIRKRDGWQSAPDIAAADWYGWRHNGSSADIVAYRVLA